MRTKKMIHIPKYITKLKSTGRDYNYKQFFSMLRKEKKN